MALPVLVLAQLDVLASAELLHCCRHRFAAFDDWVDRLPSQDVWVFVDVLAVDDEVVLVLNSVGLAAHATEAFALESVPLMEALVVSEWHYFVAVRYCLLRLHSLAFASSPE